jgi:hypothetical protein
MADAPRPPCRAELPKKRVRGRRIGPLMRSPRRLAAAFGLLTISIGWACSSSTSPTAGFTSLSIFGPSALRTAETAQFRAVGVRKDGSEEEVSAQWSVTGTALTVEVASGAALGAQPGLAQLRASVAGLSTVRSISVVPDMQGTWRGFTRVSCVNNVTGDINGPSAFCKTPSYAFTTTMTVNAQQGGALVGVLDIHHIGGFVSWNVLTDGAWDWPNVTVTEPTEYGEYQIVLNGWTFGPQTQPSVVSGTGPLEVKFTNAFGPQHYIFKVATMTLER